MPVEVAPAFHQRTLRRLAKLTGADARLRLGLAPAGRPGADVSGKPFVTDNGNYVVDLFFPRAAGRRVVDGVAARCVPGGRGARAVPGVDAAGRSGRARRAGVMGAWSGRSLYWGSCVFASRRRRRRPGVAKHIGAREGPDGWQAISVEENDAPASPRSPTSPRVVPVDGETSLISAGQGPRRRFGEAEPFTGTVTARNDVERGSTLDDGPLAGRWWLNKWNDRTMKDTTIKHAHRLHEARGARRAMDKADDPNRLELHDQRTSIAIGEQIATGRNESSGGMETRVTALETKIDKLTVMRADPRHPSTPSAPSASAPATTHGYPE